MRTLFLLNPTAGKADCTRTLPQQINVAAARAGLAPEEYTIQVTNHAGHARELANVAAQQARQSGEELRVFTAGGDGTFNEMVSGLMQLPECPEVGYLPNGSTNDFAASLHIPATPLKAAESIVNGHPFYLDVGRHNDRYFAYVASFGAFTRSSYSVPQATKNALGHFAYILEGMKDLDSLRPYRCRVETGEETFEGEFIFGAVCNSTSLGGIMKLDPSRVQMDDGAFELLLLRMPKTAIDLQSLIAAISRMDYNGPGVIFRHVQQVTVTTDEDLPWSLDGEYAPSAPRVELRNLPGAIPLMLCQ